MLNRIGIRLFFLCLLLSRYASGQPTSSLSIKPKVTTRAIVVGVSDYEEISDLDFAHRDAEAFADFLAAETSWKVKPENLQLLTNEEATMPKFHKAMKWLLAESQPNDRAIIYFSGHGDVEESVGGRLGYLLLHNSPPVDYPLGGACPVEYLDAMIATLSKDKQSEVVLITDACRSGKLAGSENGGPGITNQAIGDRFEEVIKIMSCAADQYSLENEAWGGGRGLFSYHLVNGLTGLADEDEDEQLYVYELSDYVRSKVRKESRQYGGLQIPVICCNDEAKLNTVDKSKLFALNAELSMEEHMAVGVAPKRKGNFNNRPDSTFQQLLDEFQTALQQRHLMYPREGSALAKLQDLQKATGPDSLLQVATDDLAVALQEDAQQALNAYVKTPSQELAERWRDQNLYQYFPDYLQQAAELLGKEDYFYEALRARAHYFKGVNLRLQGERQRNEEQLQAALSIQKEALQMQPHTAHTLNELGYLYYLLGDIKNAAAHFQKAIQAAPAWALAHNNLAESYRRLREYKKAEEAGLRALELDSSLVLVHMNLGLIYFSQYEDDKAKSYYDRALEIDPNYPPLHYNVGNWYRIQGHYPEGEQYLKKYLDFNPQDDQTLATLGRLYLQWNKLDTAAQTLQQCLQVNPTHRAALYNFATVRLQQERYEEAIAIFLEYKTLEPQDPDVYYDLSCAYTLQEDFDEALANLRILLEDLKYKDLDALQADPDLEALRKLPAYQDLIKRNFPDK